MTLQMCHDHCQGSYAYFGVQVGKGGRQNTMALVCRSQSPPAATEGYNIHIWIYLIIIDNELILMQICKVYFAKNESIIYMTEIIKNISIPLYQGSFNYLSCLQKAAASQQPLAAISDRLRQILTSPLILFILKGIHWFNFCFGHF